MELSKVYIVIRNDSYYSETPIQRRIVGAFTEVGKAKECLHKIYDEFAAYEAHYNEFRRQTIKEVADWVDYMGLTTRKFTVSEAHDQAYAISRIDTILNLASGHPDDVGLEELIHSVEVIQSEMKISQDPDYPTSIAMNCPLGNRSDYQIVEVDVV